jgi:signal peptidase I
LNRNCLIFNKSWFRKYGIVFFIVFLVAIGLRCFFFDVDVVSGESMNPTLQSNDVLLVAKKDICDIHRYDLITFVDLSFVDTTMVKRVVGLPGEHVVVDSAGYIWIDGVKSNVVCDVSDDYEYLDVILGDTEYYLIGDNSSESYDSRSFGVCDVVQIKGRVLCRFWPFPLKVL